MSLRDSDSRSRGQDVKVSKGLHAVVVLVTRVPDPRGLVDEGTEVGGPRIPDLGREAQQSPRLEQPVCSLFVYRVSQLIGVVVVVVMRDKGCKNRQE